jgi:hypothetical protein
MIQGHDFGNFTPGKKASAGALTSHSARLRQLTPMIGDGQVIVTTSPDGGTSVALSPEIGKRQVLVFGKVTSQVSGQAGRYNAKSFSGVPNLDATGDLIEANLGVLSEVEDLIIWFIPDIATGESSLEAGAIVGGKVVDRNVNNKLIVLGLGGGFESRGTRQGQVHMMVADNVAAWDMPQASSLLGEGD